MAAASRDAGAVAGAARQRLEENPFHVLGVSTRASRVEVEREGQKLLGMLELGLAAAAAYDTPLGRRPRTAEAVRAALAELRDPARRLQAELWARLPSQPVAPPPPAVAADPGAGRDDLDADWPRALGWRR